MNAYRDQYAQLFNGGKGVVLLAISADPLDGWMSWAKEKDYGWRFMSDSGHVVGKMYSAARSRSVFVIDPNGKITKAIPNFREIDPTAYTELGDAIKAARAAKPQ